MSTIDVATFKERTDEFISKAIAGEPTVIELNGRRAVLLPCPEEAPDVLLHPETDGLLRDRVSAAGSEPTEADWHTLKASLRPV